MEEKFYYDVYDIMRMFGVGRCKAYDLLAEIKVVSNSLPVAGKVTIADFQAWFNRPLEKQKTAEQIASAGGTTSTIS